jgi:hypothetical protein
VKGFSLSSALLEGVLLLFGTAGYVQVLIACNRSMLIVPSRPQLESFSYHKPNSFISHVFSLEGGI